MSTKTQVGRVAAVDACNEQEPRPWESPEDRRGWRTSGRGGRFGLPLAHLQLEIDLDGEQTAWIIREAQRAGVGPVAYIKSLIDGARSAAR